MKQFSGAGDMFVFDGNTILLDCKDNEYVVYFFGFEIFKFKTDDKILDYISLMGNIMCSYTIAVVEKYTYFVSDHYKVIENDKMEEGILFKSDKQELRPVYLSSQKCGKDIFKRIERSQVHSCWPRVKEYEDDVLVEEDEDLIETNDCNGNNEVDKFFNQKCVVFYERDSVYAFRQCGLQCICEQCYQNKGDIDILKCVVCRT